MFEMKWMINFHYHCHCHSSHSSAKHSRHSHSHTDSATVPHCHYSWWDFHRERLRGQSQNGMRHGRHGVHSLSKPPRSHKVIKCQRVKNGVYCDVVFTCSHGDNRRDMVPDLSQKKSCAGLRTSTQPLVNGLQPFELACGTLPEHTGWASKIDETFVNLVAFC